jgi:hypothetical protein
MRGLIAFNVLGSFSRTMATRPARFYGYVVEFGQRAHGTLLSAS